MPWRNGPLVLFHGTDEPSANAIVSTGVKIAAGKELTDFGKGFYTTTNLLQAKNWANIRSALVKIRTGSVTKAAVVEFRVDRNRLAGCGCLVFVTENSNRDFWDLVRLCRTRRAPGQYHRPATGYYDVVYGPVSLWPQTLVIKDCDQVSFHTVHGEAAIRAASSSIRDLGRPLFK